LHAALVAEGAVPRFVGLRLGSVRAADGDGIDAEITIETAPAVVFDAMVIPDGEAADIIAGSGPALEFVKDQYRHCKTILALGEGRRVLDAARIPLELPGGETDPGLLLGGDANKAVKPFIEAVAKHRHLERYSDPPRV
jgi:catalase